MSWALRIIVSMTAFVAMGAKHIGPDYDTRARYALDAFAVQLAKEYHLEFLNSGLGLFADAKESIWGINLVSHQQMSLEEGKQLSRAIAYKLLHKVFTDPLFANYCQQAYSAKRDTEVKKEYVSFRLAFWDANTNRPHYPYLAQIRLADGKLFYHYADPQTDALKEPIVEAIDCSSSD